MTRVQDIEREVRRERAYIRREYGMNPTGWCMTISNVVYRFFRKTTDGHAGLWGNDVLKRTDIPHYVGVFRTRGRGGVIAQFSGITPKDKRIIIGSVTDVHNRKEVTEAIERATGLQRWKRRKETP